MLQNWFSLHSHQVCVGRHSLHPRKQCPEVSLCRLQGHSSHPQVRGTDCQKDVHLLINAGLREGMRANPPARHVSPLGKSQQIMLLLIRVQRAGRHMLLESMGPFTLKSYKAWTQPFLRFLSSFSVGYLISAQSARQWLLSIDTEEHSPSTDMGFSSLVLQALQRGRSPQRAAISLSWWWW